MHEELAILRGRGLLELREGTLRTTRRWQAAMARAALRRLHEAGDEGYDLRAAIAVALFELLGPSHTDERMAAFVDALLPIEQLELDPGARVTAGVGRREGP